LVRLAGDMRKVEKTGKSRQQSKEKNRRGRRNHHGLNLKERPGKKRKGCSITKRVGRAQKQKKKKRDGGKTDVQQAKPERITGAPGQDSVRASQAGVFVTGNKKKKTCRGKR